MTTAMDETYRAGVRRSEQIHSGNHELIQLSWTLPHLTMKSCKPPLDTSNYEESHLVIPDLLDPDLRKIPHRPNVLRFDGRFSRSHRRLCATTGGKSANGDGIVDTVCHPTPPHAWSRDP